MPDSWAGHLPFAYELVKQLNPKILVELGTHFGNSYFTFCQAVQENNLQTTTYAVDTWQGEKHAGHYDESVFEFVSKYNAGNYSSFSYLLRCTFDEAFKQFSDESIDLLHIDGLHTCAAVKNDFETWLPKVRHGGVILFHDISCRHEDFGVWKFWKELVQKYKNTFSFDHSRGLGVLIKGEPDASKTFLKKFLSNEESPFWIELFTITGDTLRSRLIDFRKTTDLELNLIERDGQIAERDARILGLKTGIASIKNSLIWRSSWPIRYLHKKADRLLVAYKNKTFICSDKICSSDGNFSYAKSLLSGYKSNNSS